MKWKYLIYCACLSMMIASCGEEDLVSQVDFTTPYVLTDNPDDPVAHRCYELYTEYGVPIFFNDTLTVTEIGKGYDGEPLYRYETLDINWEFTERTNSSYKYTYLTEAEEQMQALDYAETYLSMISTRMRPFSILLVKEIKVDGNTPAYVEGLRTLFIGGTDVYETDEEVAESCQTMITEMILTKVKLDDALMARFENISEKNHYYDKFWSDLGVTFSDATKLYTTYGKLRLENAFDEAALNTMYADANWQIYYAWYLYYNTLPMAWQNWDLIYEARDGLVAAAANFGFISGDPSYSHMRSPNLNRDISTFVSTMLELGADGFSTRYGAFPMVMQKYQILADFIINELGMEL